MGLIKVAEISIDKLEDRKTVTAILHENGYTVGPGKRKKTETGKQLDYYLKVYVEEGTVHCGRRYQSPVEFVRCERNYKADLHSRQGEIRKGSNKTSAGPRPGR